MKFAPRIALRLALLALVVVVEVLFFPQLVTLWMRAGGKIGGPGSGVVAFRDLYVLPGAAVFLVLAALVVSVRGERRYTIAGVCVANALSLLVAIVAYRAMVTPWE